MPPTRRSLPPNHFYGSIRRGGIHPSRALSAAVNGHGGQRAGRPTAPLENPCVGRGASTPPKPAAKSLSRFTRRGGIHPSRVVRPYCCTTQKAGANISFAPAVLLLRSHSLITLFVIFRTASASSWESSYLYANFVCPFKTLTNCSLDLPSGSLFAQKHLWNGVMVVIKIVPGVWV